MEPDSFLHQIPRPYSRGEVLARPSPVPAGPGLYAWFFVQPPPGVPTDGCVERDGLQLLYVGISPSRPNSRQSLRHRLRTHYAGNAESSTLRLTLGCLLGLSLQRDGRSLTFGDGEATLSTWMERNARVSWVVHPRPWEVEHLLVAKFAPPLNIQGSDHPYVAHLKRIRAESRAGARSIGGESNASV